MASAVRMEAAPSTNSSSKMAPSRTASTLARKRREAVGKVDVIIPRERILDAGTSDRSIESLVERVISERGRIVGRDELMISIKPRWCGIADKRDGTLHCL